jgi:hypothetical protein
LFVLKDGGARAVCYAALHHHDGTREAWLDLVIGTWGEGQVTDHVTFGCRVGPIENQEEPAASLVSAAIPYGDSPIFGAKLSRDEALAHSWLSEFWEMVDFILINDPDVREHVYGDSPQPVE